MKSYWALKIVGVLLLATIAAAQDDGFPPMPAWNPEAVMVGPYGPVAVKNDNNDDMVPAIVVYEDADLAYVIPNSITTKGWLLWFGPTYRDKGQFMIAMYTWFKTDKYCLEGGLPASVCKVLGFVRRLMVVDVRNRTIATAAAKSQQSHPGHREYLCALTNETAGAEFDCDSTVFHVYGSPQECYSPPMTGSCRSRHSSRE